MGRDPLYDSYEPDDDRSQAGASEGVRPLRAVAFVFENPNWFVNLLLVSLCQIVPIAGPMVMLGYMTEIFLDLRAGDHGQSKARSAYLDFDFDRLGDYLGRGVWPFLVLMVAGFVGSIVLVPVALVAYLMVPALAFGGNAIGGEGLAVVGGVAGFLIYLLVIVACSAAMSVVLVPMALKSAIYKDFGAGFDFDFVADFVKRVGGAMLWGELVLWVCSFVLTLLGVALCCVGQFLTANVVAFAQAHLLYQLYGLYLDRGGVMLTDEPIDVPPPQG